MVEFPFSHFQFFLTVDSDLRIFSMRVFDHWFAYFRIPPLFWNVAPAHPSFPVFLPISENLRLQFFRYSDPTAGASLRCAGKPQIFGSGVNPKTTNIRKFRKLRYRVGWNAQIFRRIRKIRKMRAGGGENNLEAVQFFFGLVGCGARLFGWDAARAHVWTTSPMSNSSRERRY